MKNIFYKRLVMTAVSFSVAGLCMTLFAGCSAKTSDASQSTAAFLQEEQQSEKADLETAELEKAELETIESESVHSSEANLKESDISKYDADNSDTNKPDADKANANKSDVNKNDTSKANANKSDVNKNDTSNPDTNKPDADKANTSTAEPQASNQDSPSSQAKAVDAAETIISEDSVEQNSRNERKAAFISALEGICRNQVFPDGSEFQYDASTNGEGNQFAIYDIDFDGKEELIIQYTTTYTAGMVEVIYDYDSKTKLLKEELRSFPSLTYYNNGIVSADWSHNQGLAGLGDFWPYTLYQYKQESDTYIEIASVDAWNKEQANEDYEGNPFPDELDIDGDGFIYFVTAEGTYAQNTVVDGEEYERWRSSLLGNAKKIEVPYQTLK
jgi:uncharacterized protein YjbI with pentapeptide repeats